MQIITETHTNSNQQRPHYPRWPRQASLMCEMRAKNYGTTQLLCLKTTYGYDVVQGIWDINFRSKAIHRVEYLMGHPRGDLAEYRIMAIECDPITGARYRMLDLWHQPIAGATGWENFDKIANSLSSEIPGVRQLVRNLAKLKLVSIREMPIATSESAAAAFFALSLAEQVRIAGNIKDPAPTATAMSPAPVKPVVKPKPKIVMGSSFNPYAGVRAKPTPAGCARWVAKGPAKRHTMRQVHLELAPHRVDDVDAKGWHMRLPTTELTNIHKAVARARFELAHKSRVQNGNLKLRAIKPTEPYRPHMALA